MTAGIAAALIDGLLTGAVYALVAVGFALIYDVLRVPNLAHGALVALAMLFAWGLAATFGINAYASLPLTTLVLFATGYALHAWVIQPVSRGRKGAAVLVTGGIAGVLELLVVVVAGTPRAPYAVASVMIGSVPVGVARLAGAAGAALVGGMLFVFLTRTDTGRSIRAVAREPVAACLVGIRPARMRALAYGVGSACVGAAGCLLLPGGAVGPQTGPLLLLVSLGAAAVGGMGNLRGAIVGGLVVGVAERLGAVLLGQSGGVLAIVAVLLAALLLRAPLAFMGRRAGANA